MNPPSVSTQSTTIKLLLKVSTLFQHLRVEDVLEQLMQLAAQTVHVSDGGIVLLRGERVEAQYFSNFPAGEHDLYTIAESLIKDGLEGWAIRHRQIAVVEDTRTDSRWVQLAETQRLRSAIAVPILYQGEILAVMGLAHDTPHYFTTEHLDLIQLIANQAAIAIHNARLFERVEMNQQQTETILQSLPNALIVMDGVGRFLVVNDTMRQLLGISPAFPLEGLRITDLSNRDTSFNDVCAEWLNHHDEMQESGLLKFEVHSETSKRDFDVTISTWNNEKKTVAGYVVVMHDVTKLRDLHRFKDEMLRIASHDLRNPLALIIGYADMMQVDLPDPDSPIQPYIEAVLRYAKRMDKLLQDLLRIEKIRESPLELHERILPKPLVDEVVQAYLPYAEQKQIKFGAQTNLEFSDTFINADPVLIHQAMENLVGNALKYTPPKGSVAVISRLDFNERKFHFVVVDSGIGIPKDKLPYVFESFYRVNDPNIKGIQGMGLGLSLVRSIIEKHGGEVWVTSIENEGSRFGFWLPLA